MKDVRRRKRRAKRSRDHSDLPEAISDGIDAISVLPLLFRAITFPFRLLARIVFD